jgi:hypothetical protein
MASNLIGYDLHFRVLASRQLIHTLDSSNPVCVKAPRNMSRFNGFMERSPWNFCRRFAGLRKLLTPPNAPDDQWGTPVKASDSRATDTTADGGTQSTGTRDRASSVNAVPCGPAVSLARFTPITSTLG